MSDVLDRVGQATSDAPAGRAGNATFFEMAAMPGSTAPSPWPALLVTRAEIELEIERLLDLDRGSGERRASEIVHPSSHDGVPGVTPGLSVSINVVPPGEHLEVFRDNATRVEFVLGGEGTVRSGRSTLDLAKWSVVSLPSMLKRRYQSAGDRPLVWLSYSTVPLLQRLGTYYSDGMDSVVRPPLTERSEIEQKYVASTAPDFAILNDGARMRGYEFVTDIEVVENKPLVWPWRETSQFLMQEVGDGKRGLMVLVNPATGRRQGATHSYLAALSRSPAGMRRALPPRGHKHSSFACNYHFEGVGESMVDGQHFEWEAGDLMLSAPSWSEHAHGVTGASVLTVQDHPFHMETESLIWQEELDGPILTLGSEAGQTGYVGPREAGK